MCYTIRVMKIQDKTPSSSPVVLFFRSPQRRDWPANEKLSGIYRYARARRWLVQTLDAPRSAGELEKLIAAWNPIGLMVDMDASRRLFTPAALRGLPAVFLDFDDRLLKGDTLRVNHDPAAVARLAAHHLAASGAKDFAFLGYTREWLWSKARCDHFREALAERAVTLSVFEFPALTAPTAAHRRRFDKFLASLPKPCAMLLANDYLAEELYPACNRLGITIPDDLSVIGIDDDERFCDNLAPALSSIRLDFAQAGWLLASLLDERLGNPALKPQVRSYEPLGLSPRGSHLRAVLSSDSLIAKVDSLLADHAASGAKIPEILAPLGISRRSIEIRYRAATDRSLLDTLRSIRLERAKALASDPSVRLTDIPSLCGYSSVANFLAFFKSATGKTPSEYRRKTKCSELKDSPRCDAERDNICFYANKSSRQTRD